jgi:23S rRNA (cytidine1920-2'-O)/16S rRNA (cytidine1409-2'-O)-methyltransferase
MRIDVFLTENGLTASRTEAKTLILAGAVAVGGKVIDKPSFDFNGDLLEIKIDKSSKKYAGRGGLKLEGAIKEFSIDIKDRLAIDIGASTGGFTDCLLQNGAKHVIAVDSGSGQLADFLRVDSRVTVFENYNARYMKPDDFEYSPNLAVMDVSFISAIYIIPAVYDVLSDTADFICLIKPQFEVGRSALGKGGIVKNEKIRAGAVAKVTDFAKCCGFSVIAIAESSIRGGDGNVEYLAHFRKDIQK